MRQQDQPAPFLIRSFVNSFTGWVIVLLLFAAGCLGIFWAVMPIVNHRYYNFQPLSWHLWLRPLAVLIYGLFVFYVSIWYYAGNREERWKSHPKYLEMAIRNLVLAPGVFCAVLLVFTPLWWWAMVHYEYRLMFELTTSRLVIVLAILAVGMLIMLGIGLGISRPLRARFLANMHDRQICYQCSYDLRGQHDFPACICPECGFDHKTLF